MSGMKSATEGGASAPSLTTQTGGSPVGWPAHLLSTLVGGINSLSQVNVSRGKK